MEQQETLTSTVSNIQIPGVPSDSSALKSLRNVFRRAELKKRPTPAAKSQTTGVRVTVDEPAPTATNHAGSQEKSQDKKKSARADARSKSPTIERQTNVAPAELPATQARTTTQSSSSNHNGIVTHALPELVTRNDKIRRILERVDWTKLRGDTVQEVATFRELEDAETKFQEFESFIRAEGKNLGLPEGRKPFERVLIQGNKPGSKPCPYIRFTNFRTEEDVRKYHAALSKRKIRRQYHPPLRLCYEIQKLNFHAAKADILVKGDLGETLCGKTAVIEDGDTRRLVTIGGIIKVDNKLYAMTAGHDTTADKQLQSVSPSESSFGASTDDTEYDDDIESALICGGPSTSSDDGQQLHRGGQTDQHHTLPGPTPLIFRGSSMSGDDWSLHQIEDPMLGLPNSFPGIDGASTEYITYPASQPVSVPTEAWLLAGVSGPRAVHMIPGIMSFPLPSGDWVSAWKVALNHTPLLDSPFYPLQHGDSGSWVVDRLDLKGRVFGHVIASTDTTAYLIPLIHTLDSISKQAKLKGTGKITAIPPAFDMLADLAQAYYNKPGATNKAKARLFASRALVSSTRSSSPASEVAPIVDSFLKSHENSPAIRVIVQNILMRTGADLKGNLASMYRSSSKDSLSEIIEDSAPLGKEVAEAALRNLTIALGIPPEFPGIHETDWGRRLLLPGGKTVESRDPSSLTKPPDSEATLVHGMSGVMRRTTFDNIMERHNKASNLKPEDVTPIPGPSKPEQQDKPTPFPLLGEAVYPYVPSSTLYEMQPQTGSQSLPQAGSQPPLPTREKKKKKICGLPAMACAGISTVIAALVAAVAVLGAFLGVEVQQNNSLQAIVSELIDAVPSCATTIITTTYVFATETASITEPASTTVSTPTATSTSNPPSSSSGLSTGAAAGIGVGVGVAVLFLTTLAWFFWRRRVKLRAVANVGQSPKPNVNWDSTTAGYSYQPPLTLAPFTELSQSGSSPPVELGPSHHISPYQQYHSSYQYPSSELSMARSPEHVQASARVGDVLQLPDLNVGRYSKD